MCKSMKRTSADILDLALRSALVLDTNHAATTHRFGRHLDSYNGIAGVCFVGGS